MQGEPGDGIVIIDRYNLRPKRFLVQGNEMLSLLQSKYGNDFIIIVLRLHHHRSEITSSSVSCTH